MAWIPAVISAVGALYGAYQSNKQGKEAKKVANKQSEITDQQLELVRALQPLGNRFIQEGDQGFAPVFQRYMALASGDRNSILKHLSPEINSLNEQNTLALRNADQFSPRGGGRLASRYANMPFRTSDAISRLMYGAQSDAVDKLAGLSTARTGTGVGLLGAGFGGLSGAASSNTGFYNMLAQNRQSSMDEGNQIGRSLYDAYDQWQKSRKTGTGTGTGAP